MAFGVQAGLPYSAELEAGGESLTFRFAAGAGAAGAAKALNALGQDYVRWHARPLEGGGLLEAEFSPPSDFYTRNGAFTLLKNAEAQMAAAGLAPPENCPLCGLPACDSYAFIQPAYRPVHSGCLATRLDLPEQDITPPRRAYGHIATGILGALFGAFVAALPIWSLALTRERVYFALYAFIPLLSALLYRTFRGRASSNLAGLAVLASSLLAAMALELVWYWLVLSDAYGVNLPFWESAGVYFQTHTLLKSLREMLSCLAALLVGFVASTIFLRRYARERAAPQRPLRGAAFVRESARPMRDEKHSEL